MIIAILILMILAVVYVSMIMPRATEQPPLDKILSDYSHRGLFDNKKVPENSLAAFRNSAKYGFGIELDVQLTKDGEVVVFHDYTLDRMCGESGKISEMTLSELRRFRLLGTGEGIPTLREVLETVDGRVPLLVELKGESADDALCLATALLLDEYDGIYAVESFNPLLLRWFKTHRPAVARGQLVTNLMKNRKDGNKFLNFLLTGLFLNFLSRPDFIACDIKHMGGPAFYVCVKIFRAKQVYWTVKSRDDFNAIREAEAYSIFEGFIPR
ncbi:MAG: glycerophosphodiester phosphodiesterase [Clostridia bacterium]|nr:glycerophosphodiester phosphodiesterase [Clostridia bacterium]